MKNNLVCYLTFIACIFCLRTVVPMDENRYMVYHHKMVGIAAKLSNWLKPENNPIDKYLASEEYAAIVALTNAYVDANMQVDKEKRARIIEEAERNCPFFAELDKKIGAIKELVRKELDEAFGFFSGKAMGEYLKGEKLLMLAANDAATFAFHDICLINSSIRTSAENCFKRWIDKLDGLYIPWGTLEMLANHQAWSIDGQTVLSTESGIEKNAHFGLLLWCLDGIYSDFEAMMGRYEIINETKDALRRKLVVLGVHGSELEEDFFSRVEGKLKELYSSSVQTAREKQLREEQERLEREKQEAQEKKLQEEQEARENERKEASAVKVQKTWRGHSARKKAKRLREEKERLDREKQKQEEERLENEKRVREEQEAREKELKEEASAVKVQKTWRGHSARKKAKQLREEQERLKREKQKQEEDARVAHEKRVREEQEAQEKKLREEKERLEREKQKQEEDARVAHEKLVLAEKIEAKRYREKQTKEPARIASLKAPRADAAEWDVVLNDLKIIILAPITTLRESGKEGSMLKRTQVVGKIIDDFERIGYNGYQRKSWNDMKHFMMENDDFKKLLETINDSKWNTLLRGRLGTLGEAWINSN